MKLAHSALNTVCIIKTIISIIIICVWLKNVPQNKLL